MHNIHSAYFVTDVECSVVCVCLLVKRIYCAKTAEPIEMPFGEGLTCVGLRNHVLNGQNRTNLVTVATGDKSAMRPFAKLLWTLIC